MARNKGLGGKMVNESTYKKDEYNGWANYETWNVMMYVNNSMATYEQIKTLRNKLSSPATTLYEAWLLEYNMFSKATPDGVCWSDRKINFNEVNEHLDEMLGNDE